MRAVSKGRGKIFCGRGRRWQGEKPQRWGPAKAGRDPVTEQGHRHREKARLSKADKEQRQR